MTDFPEEFENINIEQFTKDELIEQFKKSHNEQLTHILIQPEVYSAIQYYQNQNAIQRFFQNIKWGFGDCFDNFQNWKGHLTTKDDWCFWEILNGDWSDND